MPQGVDNNTSKLQLGWRGDGRMRGSSGWEQELMAIRTTQRAIQATQATQATPAMLGIQGHQLFRGQRMEGNANEVLQKKVP